MAENRQQQQRRNKKTDKVKQSENKELDRAIKKTRINIGVTSEVEELQVCQDFSAEQVRTCWIYVSLCVLTTKLRWWLQ